MLAAIGREPGRAGNTVIWKALKSTFRKYISFFCKSLLCSLKSHKKFLVVLLKLFPRKGFLENRSPLPPQPWFWQNSERSGRGVKWKVLKSTFRIYIAFFCIKLFWSLKKALKFSKSASKKRFFSIFFSKMSSLNNSETKILLVFFGFFKYFNNFLPFFLVNGMRLSGAF